MEDYLSESDEKFDRYIKKVYASKRLLKKQIRNMEYRLALDIAKSSPMIESTFEFFLTWRLKISTYPQKMWCDGVKDLSLTYTGANSLAVSALIYIGLESDCCENMYWCQFSGVFHTNHKKTTFKSYTLSVLDKNHIYTANK